MIITLCVMNDQFIMAMFQKYDNQSVMVYQKLVHFGAALSH